MKGFFIGLFCFAVIGLFHPLVIWGEYYFSKRIWPVFLVLGLVFLALAFVLPAVEISAMASIVGFACLWSIGEINEQAKRVEKGWFPPNPRRRQ